MNCYFVLFFQNYVKTDPFVIDYKSKSPFADFI